MDTRSVGDVRAELGQMWDSRFGCLTEEKDRLSIMILVILSGEEKKKRTRGGRRRERALTISNTKTSGGPERRWGLR